jgi:hypothetical protein
MSTIPSCATEKLSPLLRFHLPPMLPQQVPIQPRLQGLHLLRNLLYPPFPQIALRFRDHLVTPQPIHVCAPQLQLRYLLLQMLNEIRSCRAPLILTPSSSYSSETRAITTAQTWLLARELQSLQPLQAIAHHQQCASRLAVHILQ